MESSTTARLLRVLLLAAVGYVFFVFHGLSSHLNPWSQALINAAVKYIYSDEGQQDTTVLLFREENLADLKTHYPVPYRLHADIIESLASYEPRAVFIDFAFVDNRDTDALKQLSKAICLLRDGGAKVFLAAPIGNAKLPEIADDLLDCASPAMPEMDGKTAESGVLTYFHGRDTDAGFLPTPAFALAADKTGIDPAAGKRLEIIWGKGIAPLNRKWMECEEKRGWKLLKEVLQHNPLADKLDCPYHRTITVNHLLNSVGDADIEAAIQGKTIFYGAGFRFTGDRVESPVYGEMPGVYLHAMAYDNLATFKKEYKQADRDGWRVKAIDAMLLLAAAWLLVFLPPPETKESDSLIDFVGHAKEIVVGIAIAAVFMAIALEGGIDVACLTGAALYVALRVGIQGDRAFGVLAGLTVVTSAVCYFWLNLGPRNILAFLAFFEIVGHYHDKLVKKAKTYHEFREKFLMERFADQEGASDTMPAWDRALCRFFSVFFEPAAAPKEPKP